MKKAIGIDLGTTNSVCTFKDTTVRVLRNKENEELTRSCVNFRGGEVLVGRTAYITLERDPLNTVLSIKRTMGGTIKDPMVQSMISSGYYRYKITEYKGGSEDAVAVVLGGKQFTPEEISAEILKKIKSDAEEKLGDEVTHAVITVPAYFTEKQKNATRNAARLAGLKVQKLLAEPTAAAISYGVDNMKPGDATTVLVYDFGGGTFDLSILNIVDGQYNEAGTGGDRWLGGDDLDRKIQEIVYTKIQTQYGIKDLNGLVQQLTDRKRFQFEGQMRYKTEEAKIQLSSSRSAQVIIDGILEDEAGDWVDIDVTISREEFESAIRPLIQRSIDMVDSLLKEVGYDISMLDAILLVGGSSCIPLVKQMLSEKFGSSKVKVSERPMLSVAEGAGILANRLGDEYEPTGEVSQQVADVSYSTNHNYFLEVLVDGNRGYDLLIEKQMPLPASVTKVVRTVTNNQKVVKVSLWADVEEGSKEEQTVGYFLLEDNLPLGAELTFEVHQDTDEVFSVYAYPKGKKNQSSRVILSRQGADKKALAEVDQLILRSAVEYRTIEGEQELLKYISGIIKDINKLGAENISDQKWHEIYYRVTEKFEEIRNNEEGVSEEDGLLYNAKRLLVAFGDVMESFDVQTMKSLITQIETSSGAIKDEAMEKLWEKLHKHGLLHMTLSLPGLAERIMNLPDTQVGQSTRVQDSVALKTNADRIKTMILNRQNGDAKALFDTSLSIVERYKQYF